MNSPFKISKDSNGLRAKLANHENEYLHQLKIQQPKEFIVTRTNEFPPLATQNRCLVHSNSLLAETEDEDDLPHSIFFQVHGISSKTNTIKTKAELEDRTNYHLEELKKYDAKTVLMLHKHGRSAPPEVTRITSAGSGSRDASNTVTSDAAPSRPTTDEVYAFTAGQQPQHRQKPRGTPYFKFWNHNGNHGKTGTNANRRAKWCTDMNLKHLAELVLAEQDAQNPELCHMNNTLNHGPSIASGVDERYLVLVCNLSPGTSYIHDYTVYVLCVFLFFQFLTDCQHQAHDKGYLITFSFSVFDCFWTRST